ncbi:MAG: hypothetical protein UT55_C0052G0010 [Candidatus Peregrinibacteria bacterium GW2011_GWE2_39_6]|nr:MAG: hypothetical protein UT36_C0010G0055 [Candidatus Peregrinibacteria bacterium GW2011_GWF2_39_17]KKR24899.1 MAG: hypothetical protein UT55_C0052G0010 [Candidatus Peregrinibacteria bacterium GW2011_GWE2_39_6]HCW32301.1 hypothetical protein [Candidatus Peregrinibacteria bacterium]
MEINEIFSQIRNLMKGGEYQKALELTLFLRKTYPRDGRSHQLLNKIKIKLHDQELKARDLFLSRGIKTVQVLRGQEDFKNAILACQELLEVDPDNRKVRNLLIKSKINFIEQKLRSPLQLQLEQQHQYDKLYLFYQKLRAVFPEYTKLNKLVRLTEKKAILQDLGRKVKFVQASLEKLQQWFAEGKLEQVINGCKELMAYSHYGLNEVHKLLKKAQKANERAIEKDSLEYMLEQEGILRKAYEANEERLIKI